jgi:hypothetical protein
MNIKAEFPMEAAKALVIYWRGKQYSGQEMATKLCGRARGTYASRFTITNWRRALERGEDIQHHRPGGRRLHDERLDVLITTALETSLFHSVLSRASTIKISLMIVWIPLHSADHVTWNLHIVPHTISPAQTVARVESSAELKKVIFSAKDCGWRHILTGDESWFCFNVSQDHIWLPEEAVIPVRPREKRPAYRNECSPFSGPRSAFCSFDCCRMGTALMRGISTRISFKKSIDIDQRPMPKMREETLPYISIMLHPITVTSTDDIRWGNS